jgi:hypothetical protein
MVVGMVVLMVSVFVVVSHFVVVLTSHFSGYPLQTVKVCVTGYDCES